ncbi:LacI family DNA-binding transcriptional regulator [Pedobacter frigiditerrae]|uniref:LacI family DNA-binding transcriptional regulator n=1 Tax=Pedobacter frigiditerrae TaxID=2530452 RepID=A0A4R0MPW0_9SPHI|nr:substrate-binding domain-containing protein [Pedobacter frigiditerrae]TCC88577.1 LacI family DNA-binding transcriptional regulator [Pedobacter frigiditerrae]
MPRVKCPKCTKEHHVLKAGFIRGKQRYLCKGCDYHFTVFKEKQQDKSSRKRSRQTTIIDIANAIGIAVSTVSRALKDHPDISEQTRQSVKKVAAELNYQPNTLAQSLSKRETRTIGVIIPDIETHFFASMLTGIQNVASEAGYKVMISQSKESHETEVTNTHAFMTNWVDGLLICHSKETKSFDHIKLYMKSGIPIIHFDRVCEELENSKVLLDDVDGAFQVTEHLIAQGCKRIALISGPAHLLVCKKRLEGYQKALKRNNIPWDDQLICHSDLSIDSILQQVDGILVKAETIDAIFCISDIGAIRIIVHLKNKGIKIPEQVCVAGFGNEPMGEIIEPGLTTFNLQTYKFGETVAQLFFEQLIEGTDFIPRTKIVKGNLIIRKSSSRPID